MSPQTIAQGAPFGPSEPERPRPESGTTTAFQVDEGKKPAVTKIGETKYRLGEVTFDAKTRELEIPVVVNMNEGGPVEYLLVHEQGKVHESIFTTKVAPVDLQIAMKLLRYEEGHGDVFNRFLPAELVESEGGREADRGDPVDFVFLEQAQENETSAPNLVIDAEGALPMDRGDWVFTGSYVDGDIFMAEAEGSIIAIYLDHIAMFNMTREGAETDERWGANGDLIPDIGTQGRLVIRPRPVTNGGD
ncbi:MAG: YdjY domain-containing protein [Verrucomicrobiota bacterium]